MFTKWFYEERKLGDARIITCFIGKNRTTVYHANTFILFNNIKDLTLFMVFEDYLFRRKGNKLQYKHVDKTRWYNVINEYKEIKHVC